MDFNGKLLEGYVVMKSKRVTVIWVPTDETWAYFHLVKIRKERQNGWQFNMVAYPICGPIQKEEFLINLSDEYVQQ